MENTKNNPFIRNETEKLQNTTLTDLLFCVFSINFGSRDRTTFFNQGFLFCSNAVVGFDGELVRSSKKRKKFKIEKTLEEGDLLFNLVLAMWFFILGLIFGDVFKLFLSYKNALIAFYFLISSLLINVIFKIVDIYMIHTKESLSEKTNREIAEKRKLKQTPS